MAVSVVVILPRQSSLATVRCAVLHGRAVSCDSPLRYNSAKLKLILFKLAARNSEGELASIPPE
jgi:hypothetical protein